MARVVDKYDCSHATRMYGDKWMKGWTSKHERPDYEEWFFVAWVWGVEKIFGKLFGKAVMEVCVLKVGGGMDKFSVFKERKGGGGLGEFVPEVVLSSVPIPSQPTSQLRRATNEKSRNYRSNIKSSRSASHSHKTGVYGSFQPLPTPFYLLPATPPVRCHTS